MKQEKKWTIKKSTRAGQGTFVKRDIPQETIIGRAFTQKQETGVSDKDYVHTQLGAKTNHAQKSNTTLVQKGASWYRKSTRNIKKGEEITLNYNTIPWPGKRRFHSSSKSTPASPSSEKDASSSSPSK